MWWDPYNKKVAFARGREWDWKFYQKNLRKWEYLSLKIKKHRFNGDYLAIILKTLCNINPLHSNVKLENPQEELLD